LQITVDVKRLYKRLCSKCKEKLLDLAELKPDKEMIRRALEGGE